MNTFIIRFGAVFMNLSEGIWIIDDKATTLYANASMAEILGTEVSKLVGKPSFRYVFPEDVEAAQRLFDALSQGERTPFHFRLRREDGSAIFVDVQGTPMHNAENVFIGIVGTFRVSERQS